MKKENKGITLIALIITIIVMLILVAVTINVAMRSRLFEHAKDATKQWAQMQENETNIGNDNYINDVVEQYIGDIEQKDDENIDYFYIDDKKYTSYDGDFWKLAIWNTGIACLEENGYSVYSFHYAHGDLWCDDREIYLLNLSGKATLELVSSNDDFVFGGRYYVCGSEEYNAVCEKYNIII